MPAAASLDRALMSKKTVVRTETAPAPFQGAPYSQAIRAGGLVFVSGQLALRPDHAEIAGETIQEQTEQVFARHVGHKPPARATIEVSALPSGAKVEIEAIATV